MANKVGEIVQDVMFRTGVENQPAILRTMNRIYKRLNRKYKAISKDLEMDFAAVSPTATWAKPADMIEIYNVDPYYAWVPPRNWDSEITGYYYTVKDGYITFPAVTEDTVITFGYYSYGLTLIDDVDGNCEADVSTNTPEWPEDLHEVLMLKTCVEVSPDYPLRNDDLLNIAKTEQFLGHQKRRIQSKDAETIGDRHVNLNEDDYGLYSES